MFCVLGTKMSSRLEEYRQASAQESAQVTIGAMQLCSFCALALPGVDAFSVDSVLKPFQLAKKP